MSYFATAGRCAQHAPEFGAKRGRWGLLEMLQHELERYAQAYYRVFGALTALDAMCQEFAAPDEATRTDAARADELNDLAARMECLTATWEPRSAAGAMFWR